ncbi:hypothetical protein [Streptantibioticus ferralitis]|uniref:Uncharacterized protein n=1 Tax=Streptantibioticus ferralitis TaxID=236510 RepID=A0ABT5Z8T5_9ACTN|nr:hypothetical protein [Streptantibioticus ferralitis]MDF2260245.1 hypothetical protein [Streptantibioticus ferralitis]
MIRVTGNGVQSNAPGDLRREGARDDAPAEKGASTPVLMKLSGHTSVRSLAKYAQVSDEGLLNSQADTDPAARRHRQRSGELSVAGEQHDEY